MKLKPITIAGLILAAFGPLLAQAIQYFAPTTKLQNQDIAGLVMIWLVGFGLLAIVKWGEYHPLASIGFKSISVQEILLAIILGIALSLLVPVLSWLSSQFLPSDGGGIQELTANTSWGLILFGVLTAGIVEELLYRGYMLERLYTATGKFWAAILISLAAFVLPHTFSWNTAHVIGVVLPLGLILSGLYVWKRNLIFNMIIHLMIDLPLVIMALLAN